MATVNLADDEVEWPDEEPAGVMVVKENDQGGEQGGVRVKITKLTADDVMSLEFGCWEEAWEFYRKYARCKGFGVRKDNVYKNNNHETVGRRFVCNREGAREQKYVEKDDRVRCHRELTRTNCRAVMRVNLDRDSGKWLVKKFNDSDNHEMTDSEYIHLMPSHRRVANGDKAQIDGMAECGVRSCHIMSYMIGQSGGHNRVGFIRKDLYNNRDKTRHEKLKDGDAYAALRYLKDKAEHDPMYFALYTVTPDGKLKDLFWTDGQMQLDYECFGDVVSFDSTYGKNKYNRPLVIFSGSNHHDGTAIFGAAILSDETAETYKWLLNTMMFVWNNKAPKAVVTDGDLAMKEAIREVWPDASHRLCSWHMENNAISHVRNPKFLDDFTKAIYANFTREAFEDHWQSMTRKHSVERNNWVKNTYKSRDH